MQDFFQKDSKLALRNLKPYFTRCARARPTAEKLRNSRNSTVSAKNFIRNRFIFLLRIANFVKMSKEADDTSVPPKKRYRYMAEEAKTSDDVSDNELTPTEQKLKVPEKRSTNEQNKAWGMMASFLICVPFFA